MKIEDCFYIGYITKTKGLKGEVQLYYEFGDYEALEFDCLFLEIQGKLVPYFVSSSKLKSNQTGYLIFEDIDTIEKAETLVRKKAYLPNNLKPERQDDEFYYTDLKGFIAHDENYGELGEIIEVHEYPQQYVAVVSYKFREIMFPLNEQIIKSIDEDEGLLEVALPDGLIDVYINS